MNQGNPQACSSMAPTAAPLGVTGWTFQPPSPVIAGIFTEFSWKLLTQDSGCIVSILDRDGRVVYGNDELARFVGKPIHEIIGRTILEVLPEDFAQERMNLVRRAAATGDRVTLVTHIMGGRMHCCYRPLPEPSGITTYVLAIGRHCAAPATTVEGEVVEVSTEALERLGSLTGREREVLALIGKGLSTAQIADRLFRTVKTVEAHRASLGRKLGVTNRVQLARIAIQAGITPHPENDDPIAARARRMSDGHPPSPQ